MSRTGRRIGFAHRPRHGYHFEQFRHPDQRRRGQRTFNLSVGTFNASTFGLTISQGGNWAGGIFGGLVTNNSPAASPFTLNFPNGNLDLPNTTFVNNGTVVWTAGTIRGNGSTVISNNAFWLMQASNGIMNSAYGGTPVFDNNAGASLEVNPPGGTIAINGSGLREQCRVPGRSTVASGALHPNWRRQPPGNIYVRLGAGLHRLERGDVYPWQRL